MKKDFLKLLLIGLAALGMSPAMVQTASAEGGQVLNIAAPGFCPRTGRPCRVAVTLRAGSRCGGLRRCISTRTAS